MTRRICTVIVNYKTTRLTRDCVASLAPQLDLRADHIMVVDNASGGEELESLKAELGDFTEEGLVSILPLAGNGGFSAGNNAGISAGPAEYYLLTNSDTLFHPGAVAGLLEGAEANPRAGLISPRLEGADGEPQVSCFRFHAPPSEAIRSANMGVITRLLGRYDVPLLPVSHPTFPDWTSFACVLVRAGVVEKAGLLDDGFFMYYEDADYCRRARRAGFEIVNWPQARVVHLQGKSSEVDKQKRENRKLPDYYYHSRARYYRKFYGGAGFFLANVCWILGRAVSGLRQLSGGKGRPVPRHEFFNIWKSKSV